MGSSDDDTVMSEEYATLPPRNKLQLPVTSQALTAAKVNSSLTEIDSAPEGTTRPITKPSQAALQETQLTPKKNTRQSMSWSSSEPDSDSNSDPNSPVMSAPKKRGSRGLFARTPPTPTKSKGSIPLGFARSGGSRANAARAAEEKKISRGSGIFAASASPLAAKRGRKRKAEDELDDVMDAESSTEEGLELHQHPESDEDTHGTASTRR